MSAHLLALLPALLIASASLLRAQSSDASIPGLGARVTRVRFFEGGPTLPSLRDRQYTARFDSSTARSIYVEIALAYPPAPKATSLKVECSLTPAGGGGVKTAIIDVEADLGWELSVHAGGTGEAVSGSWRPGSYQVTCRYEGKVLANGGFEVSRPAPAAVGPAPRGTRPESKAAAVAATFGGLKARVMAIRLFESGGVSLDPKQRVITTQFDARTTRFINVELELEYAKAAKKTEFEIQCGIVGPDSVARALSIKGSVEAGWTGSYHTARWGSRERGQWPEGSYRLSCREGTLQVVAADFSVVANAPAVAALGAALTHFRFFHAVGERLPVEARRYASRFDTRSARWIKTEFGLVYPAVPAATSFSVECAYAFPDGTIRPVKMERRIPAGWTGSVHAQGIGWGSSGNWPVGTYRVSCRSEGREFGAGSFELIDNTAPPAVQGALLAVFGRKGPIGGAPDTRFVLGQFDSLFAEATFPSRIAGDSTLLHCTAFDPLGEAAGFEIPTAVKNRMITGTGRIPLDPPLARGLYSVECRINNRSVGVERFEMTGAPEVKALDARLLGSALYEGGDQSPDDEAVSDESFSATRVRSFWLMMLFDHPSDAGAGPLGYGCKVTGARNVVIGDSGPQTATIAPGERAIVLTTRLALLPRQRWIPGRYIVTCTGGAGSLLSTRFELTR